MKKKISEWLLLKLWGWKLLNPYPNEIAKSIVPVLPHTSNWDFPIGMLLRPIMNTNIRFAAKDSLFIFPFGWLFKKLGGYPVNRSKASNFVNTVVEVFKKEDDFKLCITPEGTRKKVTTLKRGFYYIAQKADVPLILCKFDWGKKEIDFSPPFYVTGDYDADITKILDFYKGSKGKIAGLGYFDN
jgi:1-acyl-sn-glycerol-3-phosphate acyltransferase